MRESESQRLIVAFHAALLLGVSWLLPLNWEFPLLLGYQLIGSVAGLMIAQIGLVAVWAALGSRSLLVRSLGLPFTAALACCYANITHTGYISEIGWWNAEQHTSPTRYIDWIAPLGTLFSFTFVGLTALRVIGLRFSKGKISSSLALPRRQFSVLYGVTWITYLALLCAIWRWLTINGWSAQHLLARLRHGPLLPPLEFAALTIISTLALLSQWSPRYMLPYLLMFPFVLIYFEAQTESAWLRDDVGKPMPWSIHLGAYLGCCVAMWASLLWGRYRGYRIAWHGIREFATSKDP